MGQRHDKRHQVYKESGKQYARAWRQGFSRLMILALALAGIFAIAYFLYWMPKPARPQPTPSGQAAILTTHRQHTARMQFLKYLSRTGVIHKFSRNEKGAATLWVDNNFYILTFQNKEKTVIAAAMYYWATVATPRPFAIKDWRTKKTIGEFGTQGLILFQFRHHHILR